MKKISIIVPMYNSCQKAIRLLNSIPLQKLVHELEVIIVDDNSSEDITPLRHYVGENTNVFLYRNNRENSGAGSARNIGIEKSVGRWLIFADADDTFTSQLTFVVNKAESLLLDYDITYFNCTGPNSQNLNVTNRYDFLNSLVNQFFHKSDKKNELRLRSKFVTPWGKVFKSDFIKENKISFETIQYSNDIFFSVRSGLLANKIQARKEKLYCVYKSVGGLTSGKTKKEFYIRAYALGRTVSFMKKNLSKEEYKITGYSSKSVLFYAKKNYDITFMDVIKAYFIFKKFGLNIFNW